jgi:hypothetical protein
MILKRLPSRLRLREVHVNAQLVQIGAPGVRSSQINHQVRSCEPNYTAAASDDLVGLETTHIKRKAGWRVESYALWNIA